jgi:hypothetical protein
MTHYVKKNHEQTTQYVDLLMGEVDLGDPSNQYVYIGPTARAAELAAAQFASKLMAEKQPVVRNVRHIVQVGRQQFRFLSVAHLLGCGLCGLSVDRYFLDLTPQMRENILHHDPRYEEARISMMACLRNPIMEQDFV